MAGLYLHPLVGPKVPLLQEVDPCQCRTSHDSPPLLSGYGPPTSVSPRHTHFWPQYSCTCLLFRVPPTMMNPMSVIWRRFCRCITNCVTTTNATCLHREACLLSPPVLVRHQRHLAGLMLICCPPEIYPASPCLPNSVPTFSPHLAPLVAGGKITSRPYLFFNLDWRSAAEKVKNPRYRYNTITALANSAVPLVHNVVTLPHISLHLTYYLCNDPTIGSYNNYHLSPNGIPSGNQR